MFLLSKERRAVIQCQSYGSEQSHVLLSVAVLRGWGLCRAGAGWQQEPTVAACGRPQRPAVCYQTAPAAEVVTKYFGVGVTDRVGCA